ncbi:MAG TPA: UDP-glucose/GDP-mannose dehydrogenase family protein [Candidatus Limnocylindria bacterium]|nr:UDP-glucose/GDP-mannose dehydrogenase family protein [Candidatus Limnocylindria bacterium]
MNISIFGLGYVGCVGAGCLAKLGHKVVGVDPQATKVEFINQGKATIVEPGIDELIATERRVGKISATLDVTEAIRATDVSFICVGTPSTTTGHLDLSAVCHVAEQIGLALKNKKGRHVIAIRSTVLPGTIVRIANILGVSSGKRAGEDFAVVSNPEFLREGTSIEDFSHPPFTLVGTDVEWAKEMMQQVYSGIDAPFLVTAPHLAEMVKYVCNSFHALKIAFANEVGNICDKLQIDSHALMDIFCRDTKLNISRAYLKPGFAYGGSCLPKDLKALCTIAHDHYLSCPLLESIEKSNQHQKDLVCREIQRINKQNVGFLGLSFKPGTDDLRESPIVDVIERLLGKGFNVRIYDRNVHVSRLTGANKEYIVQKIPFIGRFITDDLPEVLEGSDLIVVVNNEPGLKEALQRLPADKMVYDLARVGLHGARPASPEDVLTPANLSA